MHQHRYSAFETRQADVMRTILDAGSLAIPYLATEEYRQGFVANAGQMRTSGQPSAGNAGTSLLSLVWQRGREVRAALAAQLQSARVAGLRGRAASTTTSL